MKTKAILDYSHKTKNPCEVVWWWLFKENLKKMTNLMGSAYYFVPSGGWAVMLEHLHKMGLSAIIGDNKKVTVYSR